MRPFCSILLFVFLLACMCVCVHSQITTETYLVANDWHVESPSQCTGSSCCCLNGAVNIYVQDGEMNVNGTVSSPGNACDQPIKMDNLNSQFVFSWAEEFFGIDDYVFTLANATYHNQSGWSLSVIDAATQCSFTLFRASAVALPPPPSAPPATTPQPIPTWVTPYLGNWTFDSTTCQIHNTTCCCLVGLSTISVEAGGNQQLAVSGPPSVGCAAAIVQGTLESDDFTWPSMGTTTASTVAADGLLENQDTYTIQFEGTATLDVLLFTDQTRSTCSMRATKVLTVPQTNTAKSITWSAATVILAAATAAVLHLEY